MAVVVISSDEKGDRLVGSLEVKAPVAGRSGQIRTGGEQLDRPQQRRTRKPRNVGPAGSGLQDSWESRAIDKVAKAYVGIARLEQTDSDLPGVVEGGMSRRNDSESLEPLVAGLGRRNPAQRRRCI